MHQLDAGSSPWKYLKCTPLTEHQTPFACAVKFTQTMATFECELPALSLTYLSVVDYVCQVKQCRYKLSVHASHNGAFQITKSHREEMQCN